MTTLTTLHLTLQSTADLVADLMADPQVQIPELALLHQEVQALLLSPEAPTLAVLEAIITRLRNVLPALAHQEQTLQGRLHHMTSTQQALQAYKAMSAGREKP